MKKYFTLFTLALCLCIGKAWAYTGSNPLSGGNFYIYHPNSGKFLSSNGTGDNKMIAASTPELWTVASPSANGDYTTVKLYHAEGNTGYYFNIRKNGGSFSLQISTSPEETTELIVSNTNTEINAYKIARKKDGPKYLNYNNGSFSVAGSTSDQNDWIFISESELQYISSLLSSSKGWEKITSLPANLDDYYYCFVDNSQPLMINMATGTSNQESLKTLFYSKPANPLVSTDYLWTITNNSSYSCQSFRNVLYADKFVQTRDNEPWKIQAEWESTPSEWTQFLFEYDNTNHWWTIKNKRFEPTAYYLGSWTENYNNSNFVPGLEFAGNKGTASNSANYVGHFQIYAIPKTAFLNCDFESNPWNFAWTGTGDNNAAAFKVQDNGAGGFDSHFVEMWNSKNNSIDAGDINQTVKLPAGVYKLSADVISRRLTSKLYASFNSQEVAYNCTNISDAKTTKAIIFGFDSETNVQIGYKHGAASSSEGDVWSAVDNFTLSKVEKLNLTITPSFGSDAIYVDSVISSAFTFTYDDSDFTPSAPTLGSGSSDFYYTITTNTISSVKTGCNGSHTSDVITYDPSTNKITAWNAGTATITLHQNATSTINAKEVSYNITVGKYANPITVTLAGVESTSKNIGFNKEVSFTYSALNDGEVTITKRDGGAGAATLANDKSKFTSAETEGVDYWDLSIAENYKYEASSTFVRIQVNAIPETESYLDSLYLDSSYEIQSSGSIEINLAYSPLEIRYQAKRNNFFSITNSVCTSYDANGSKLKEESDGLDTDFKSKTHALSEATRKVVLSRSGGTGTPIVKQIYVVRRTYVNASVDNADLGEVLVGNTNTATITVDWGTSNGKNISVVSNNAHFTVSSSEIDVEDNSNGTANITVTYTPVAGVLGAEQAIITISDRYHSTTVNLQGTAINNKALVNGYGFMYNSSHKIKIDDTDTKVYEALYTSGTQTVTLNELAPIEGNLIIPAGKVVLLYKAADKEKASSAIHYEYSTADNAYVLPVSNDNCFAHHDGSSTSFVNYVLAKQDGVVAFYKYTGSESSLNGYNVLQLPSGVAGAPSVIRIVTEGDNATALVPVYGEQPDNSEFGNGQIYTILGIPVHDMTRPGIYIQNGKKYVVR